MTYRYAMAMAAAVLAACLVTGAASAQTQRTLVFKPQYLPPAELEAMLGAHDVGARRVVEWSAGGTTHAVEVRRNDASNMVVLSGASEEVGAVEDMAKAFDVPPRQVSIEARIVEMDADKARDAGFDWSRFSASVQGDQQWQRQGGGNFPPVSINRGLLDVNGSLTQAIKLLEEQGIATTRDAPRILTLNNHEATILDGQRVTYVTRYSSYANVFATDSMDAGLRLDVIPSVGESGYLRLDLKAELTTLSSDISGSPVKDGQIVENTVTVKDGQTVLLGGFTRTLDSTRHRRFPLLGSVLPFLFSREITDHSRRESFIVITPHVVDLEATLDPDTRKAIEGR
ncbi:MAG TPA: hypothetical protein VL332_08950 [Candidatus Saccharimonadaceae bacterium]|jgi:type II secretory pathway component GspD/PulD (secretin)|nr:hypothetical protein [Candidatus Saccharimonadaceae bacterium]